jgi:hypothetical protein
MCVGKVKPSARIDPLLHLFGYSLVILCHDCVRSPR